MIAMGAGLGVPHTLAAEPERTPGVGPGRDFGPHRSVHCPDLDLATPVGLRKGNRDGGVDVVAVTFERSGPGSREPARRDLRAVPPARPSAPFAGNPHPLTHPATPSGILTRSLSVEINTPEP